MSRYSSLLFLAAVVCTVLAFGRWSSAAQAKPTVTETAKTSADYAKEGAIFERSTSKLVFNSDGTGTRETTNSVRIASQAGLEQFAVLTFPYLSSSETLQFDYIRVRKSDGTVVVTPDSNVLDMTAEVTRAAPMYSDVHEKHVTVKGLAVGDLLEYSTSVHIFKPQVPGQFWFEHTFHKGLIVLDSQLQISVPRDKYVKVVSPDYKPEIKDDGAYRTYVWKRSNPERNESDRQFLSDPSSPSIQLTTFRSWDEVGRWYAELQRPQITMTPQLQARAAELTKGLTSEGDKIRVIYEYVSGKFHYVSLSFGVGRYQPHASEEVFENAYGDCKDKHTLLATLLRAAGIEAWPALMNAMQEVDPDVPSPGQFNHVITYVPRSGDNPLWLDTTPEVAPFGLLMNELRGKLALVVSGSTAAELMRTPAHPPFPATSSFTIAGKLDGNDVFSGHIQQSFRGDMEVFYRAGFRATAPAHWKEVAQRASASQGFDGKVTNVSVSAPDDLGSPFQFSYDYIVNDFGEWANHRITIPLPILGIEKAATSDKKPAKPLEIGWIGEWVLTAKVELPADVVKLPADLALSESWADFESKYTLSGRTLTVSRRFKAKQNEVPLEQWQRYKEFSQIMADDWGAWIELRPDDNQTSTARNSGAAPAAGSLTQPSSTNDVTRQPNRAIAQKIQQAVEALERGDTTTAEEIVRAVMRTDPDMPRLHALLGLIYGKRGNDDDAIRELVKEEELHPDEIEVYSALGAVYEEGQQYRKEEDQFRKWLARDPKNLDAMIGLNEALSHQKKTAERVALWEKAITIAPDSATVRTSLARAYVDNRQTEKGIPLLEESLASETNPMLLNDAAYDLADQNVHLEKAQEWGEKALVAIEGESLKTDSDEAALTNVRQIGTVWDTMGWIYFRLGEFEKAEAFLRAAFILTQSTDAGDHLGQLYQRQEKKEAAAHQYLLAIASADSRPKGEVRKHYGALTGKNLPESDEPPHLSRSHGRPTGTYGPPDKGISPGEELSRARTTKIYSAARDSGSANFSIVFSPGKIEDVKFLTGNEKLKSMIDSILTSKLRAEFPNGDAVRLTRRGIMFCSNVGCEITLLLPDDVHVAD